MGMPQAGLGGILLTLTGSPIFVTMTTTGNMILPPGDIPASDEGVFEGIIPLIRSFRPLTNDGWNIFIGGAGNTTLISGVASQASNNIGIGRKCQESLTTGFENIAIGSWSHFSLTTGSRNVAIGFGAENQLSTGSNNVAVGAGCHGAVMTGSNNVAIGAGAQSVLTTGAVNVAVGRDAHKSLTTGSSNDAIGGECCMALTIGSGNNVMGDAACHDLIDGNFNTIIGSAAAFVLTSGSYNAALGSNSLNKLTTGSYNVAVGHEAGYSIIATAGGVFIGRGAGYFETGANKLFIDNATRATEADGRIKALVYGIFDAVSANQRLRINGRLGITHLPNYANDAAAGAGGLISGELYTVTASNPLQVAAKI